MFQVILYSKSNEHERKNERDFKLYYLFLAVI